MAALYIGLFLIGIGFLVKAFPNLIAGYNKMSQKQKANVDIVGLSNFIRNGLILIGLVVIIGYNGLNWAELNDLVEYFIPVVILTGVILLIFRAEKFNQNEEKLVKIKLKNVFTIAVVVLVTVMIGYGLIPTKYEINNDFVKFTGKYGTEVKLSEIESVTLIDKMPVIKARTNGLGLGPIRKGVFSIEDLGRCRLLLHAEKGPFVKISTKDQGIIFVNFKDQAKTEFVYSEITALKKL